MLRKISPQRHTYYHQMKPFHKASHDIASVTNPGPGTEANSSPHGGLEPCAPMIKPPRHFLDQWDPARRATVVVRVSLSPVVGSTCAGVKRWETGGEPRGAVVRGQEPETLAIELVAYIARRPRS
jgi:hypothetical protein